MRPAPISSSPGRSLVNVNPTGSAPKSRDEEDLDKPVEEKEDEEKDDSNKSDNDKKSDEESKVDEKGSEEDGSDSESGSKESSEEVEPEIAELADAVNKMKDKNKSLKRRLDEIETKHMQQVILNNQK